METKIQTGLKNFKPKKNLNHNIYMLQHCLVLFYRAFCMASLLNIAIHVSFKTAGDLYFLWYTIYYWAKPRQLSGYITV